MAFKLLFQKVDNWKRVHEKNKNSASTDGGPPSRDCARETLHSAPDQH